MTEFWMTKTQDGSGLVLKSDFDNSVTNSSLANTVTALSQQVTTLSQQVTTLTQELNQLIPVVVNLTYTSTINLQPNQVLNAMMVISTPLFAECALTLPSISSLVAYDTNAAVGKGFYVTLINNGSPESAAIVTYGTGFTLVGSASVSGETSGRFYFAYTDITSGQQAITIYRIS